MRLLQPSPTQDRVQDAAAEWLDGRGLRAVNCGDAALLPAGVMAAVLRVVPARPPSQPPRLLADEECRALVEFVREKVWPEA